MIDWLNAVIVETPCEYGYIFVETPCEYGYFFVQDRDTSEHFIFNTYILYFKFLKINNW